MADILIDLTNEVERLEEAVDEAKDHLHGEWRRLFPKIADQRRHERLTSARLVGETVVLHFVDSYDGYSGRPPIKVPLPFYLGGESAMLDWMATEQAAKEQRELKRKVEEIVRAMDDSPDVRSAVSNALAQAGPDTQPEGDES